MSAITTPFSDPPAPDKPVPRLKFANGDGFQIELRRRVDDYFRRTGRRQRDCPRMYLKTAILLASSIGSYALLVFAAQAWWQALPLAVFLGLSLSAVGFNIQHDGGHQAYSNYAWINKLMALSLDLIGGSSYTWHWKHAVFHHTYANIAGHDSDIELGIFGRLSPQHELRNFHQWQHLYLWPLYGAMAIKWHLWDDFRDVIAGRMATQRFPRPRGWNLAIFLAGKVLFFGLAFGIPLLFHSFWVVALFYGVAAFVLGLVLSVVFQQAHCVEEAEFPVPDAGRIENAWAIHQTETTVNFSRRSRVACWLLGGLNFQIEHHLFPRICHVNYPALAVLVEQTCRDFGVKYAEHTSFWAGMASHYRWLRRMGRPEKESAAT